MRHCFFFQAEDGIRDRDVTGVQTCALPISALPALSVERYSIVCTPSFEWSAGAATRIEVPLWKAPPSTRCSVEATPESASPAVSVTVTADALQPAGASSVVTGSVVSMRTVALRSASTLSAASVDRYAIVCAPSLEWSAGAEMTTEVPFWTAPPSTRYSVEATPEPESVGVSVTVTAVLLQPAGASSAVAGASTSTLAMLLSGDGADWLPTLSETK